MLRIMLNTNIYCRPFDDQLDNKIKDEAEMALKIMSDAIHGNAEIITSDVLYEEIDLIKDKNKKDSAFNLVEGVENTRVSANQATIELADKLHEIINDYNDCLHIASAAVSNCDFLITCDSDLLKKKDKIERFLLSKRSNTTLIHPSEYAK